MPESHVINSMSANNYLITVFWHGINDTTFPMTRHSDKMTRDSRHGIIYFWKFSKKSFNQWVCGQGIKILKNPYMGTSRDLIGRCPCGDDNFFWKLLPKASGWRILHKKIVPGILDFFLCNEIFFENKNFFEHIIKLLVQVYLRLLVKFWNL